jgi:hypothetical protein
VISTCGCVLYQQVTPGSLFLNSEWMCFSEIKQSIQGFQSDWKRIAALLCYQSNEDCYFQGMC